MFRRLLARARAQNAFSAIAVAVPLLAGAGVWGLRAPTLGAAPSNPLVGAVLFVDEHSVAAQQVAEWSGRRPEDARQLEKIARQPQADWFGDWNRDVKKEVATRVRQIRSAESLPVLVAYDIPGRDCGNHSAGGARGAGDYADWIENFGDGLGRGGAIVILEPDALAGADCLSDERREARYRMIRDAVKELKSHPGVRVYIDAGHASWKSPAEIAERLRRAGVDEADGFSLNVSNTISTELNVHYGERVSTELGGAHFVIDTSRNGLGAPADGEWCNPSGRGLGRAPTVDTGHGLVDAYLWVKRPGESDGTCNGGPRAGQWWPDYALGLAQRARS